MFYKLESLRGIAACMVILYHLPYTLWSQGTGLVSNSYLFVDLFFMLSGFVLQHAYAEKIKQGLAFSTFISMRFFRIYPIHVFMLVAFVGFVGLKMALFHYGIGGAQEFDRNNWQSALTHLLLLHAFNVQPYLTWNEPSWSISAEFYTYMVFFAYVKWLDKRLPAYLPGVIALGLYLWLLNRGVHDLNYSYDLGFVRCLAGFYLGMTIHRYRETLQQYLPPVVLAEMIATLLAMVGISFATYGHAYEWLSIAAFALLLLVLSQERTGWLGRLLLWAPLLQIGKWSYSIYMTHILVVFVMVALVSKLGGIPLDALHGWGALLVNTLTCAITIAVSRWTFVHIEDKYRQWYGQRLKRARKP